MSDDPRPTAAESWRATVAANKDFRLGADALDAELGRQILHGDLGNYRDQSGPDYYLDEDTRDRLIAHARQDAAHAVIVSTRTLKIARRLQWACVAIIALLLLILLRG
jgi:hypothetical protein